ncbi:ABC transporter permease [Gordonia amicalis]|uniref:ABC transporter permease n=1 Tax=Gordonia amicalis TaxID=89053 RepID=UPI0003F739B6|nr:ABC transporter permease [Gordonia amicalis]MCZ0911000.1 ABC transporter permease [Gordonia amicalis]MDJ0453913.1 ABC transporter permease [Gordonia amicalis]MDV7077058.1 ABC transporter permease [Gordonia amicalis]UKO92469.1 ABC transporter permease [Gordonia amicalis]
MTVSVATGRAFRGLRPLLVSEARLMWRNPMLIVWVGVLPILAAVILASIPATRQPAEYLGGQSWFGMYQPLLVMFSTVMCSVQILPDVLTRYRERGILKRLQTTPASPVALLTAQAILTFVIEVVVAALIVLLPLMAGASAPANMLGFVIAFVFSALAMLAIGMVLAAVFRNNKVAAAAGTALFFVLQFFAGLWWPRQNMPDWMRSLSDASPTGASVGALTDAVEGAWPSWIHLAILLAWGVGLSIIAIRLFRWD